MNKKEQKKYIEAKPFAPEKSPYTFDTRITPHRHIGKYIVNLQTMEQFEGKKFIRKITECELKDLSKKTQIK